MGSLRVKVGTVVTFWMSKLTRETHTVTIGDTAKGGYVYNLVSGSTSQRRTGSGGRGSPRAVRGPER